MNEAKYLDPQWECLTIEDENGKELAKVTRDEVTVASSIVIRLMPAA